MDKTVKILLVDDHYVVRQGLKKILAEHCPSAVFGDAASAQQALDLAWKEPWDVVLLDVSLPGRGGLDVLKDLRAHFPKLPVIVVSMLPEEQFALRVLKRGAFSFIRKDSARQDLIKGLDAALRGAKYITPSVAEQLATNLDRVSEGPAHETLSDREYQVMCRLASGKMVKEIATDLSLSTKTVSTYRTRILGKMKLENNSQLVRYALRHKLVDPEE